MTECIARNNIAGDTARINVTKLLLFDAPLFGPIVHENDNIFTKALTNTNNLAIGNKANNNLDVKVSAHFAYCTDLLKAFYKDNESPYNILAHIDATTMPFNIKYNNILGCVDIIIFRAAEDEISSAPNDNKIIFQQLTSAVVKDVIRSPGNHWTMLFGENATFVARIIKENCSTM